MAITLDGTTGITTPGLTNTGTETVVNLTTTGNTTLGDATTDTLTVGVTGIVKDASGNVGIGTASPRTSKLDVMSATGTQNTSGDGSGLVNITGPNGANGSQPIFVIATNDAMAANIGPAITFQARYLTSSTAAATIGYIQGIKENATSNNLQGALVFVTRNSAGNFPEAGRFDSSGNLLVGATSQIAGERLTVTGAGSYVATFNQSTNTSGFHVLRLGLNPNGNNTSSYFLHGNTNTVGNWFLYGNGTTSFSSDSRLKKNIETTRDGYLEDVAKLRVVKYNWRNDEEGKPRELGLIAQEVEQVFPGLVQDDKEKVSEDDETRYKSLKQSVLPFMLLKAIQELKAIVDAQGAEIAALKGAAP